MASSKASQLFTGKNNVNFVLYLNIIFPDWGAPGAPPLDPPLKRTTTIYKTIHIKQKIE
jgi:hypothetical protein